MYTVTYTHMKNKITKKQNKAKQKHSDKNVEENNEIKLQYSLINNEQPPTLAPTQMGSWIPSLPPEQ